MFTHIRSTAPNMSAKFGWKTRTFCHKKVAKVIAELESARLQLLADMYRASVIDTAFIDIQSRRQRETYNCIKMTFK